MSNFTVTLKAVRVTDRIPMEVVGVIEQTFTNVVDQTPLQARKQIETMLNDSIRNRVWTVRPSV